MFLEALVSVLPTFALIGIGYAAATYTVMRAELVDALETFVFYFAIPAFLFRMTAQAQFPASLPLDLWGTYYGALLAVWLLAAIGLLWFQRPLPDKGIILFGSGFSNSVLLGIPIILTTLGESAAVPLFLLFSIHPLIQFSVSALFMEVVQRRGETSLLRSAEGLLLNPVLLALGAGFLQARFALPLPHALEETLELLAQAALPTALFCAGALLTHCQGRLASALPTTAAFSTLFKLGVHPLIVYTLGTFVFALPPLWLATATLMAALPSGIYTLILAHKYQTRLEEASGIVILSTVVSLLTLPLILSLLRS